MLTISQDEFRLTTHDLQNAINEAAEHPSHTLCVQGDWTVDSALLLPSDITIILDNCHLTLAEGIYDNLFRNRNMYTDHGSQHHIYLIGKGTAILDGGTPNDLHESTSQQDGRPHVRANNLVLLHNVTDYSIENITCRNMRYWAINQIACTRGRVANIHFESGTYVPNQDGINFRVGCSHCLVENITGQTGDDTVALSAFPCGSDGSLLPDGLSPDIHDITVRNVSSCTHQTIVALRNTDGAKLYNVTVENVEDNGGNYRPWGVVRIGENAYFRNRPTAHGDVHHITVDGVRSLGKGTVFINMTLKDSVIRNVHAAGTSMSAVSTFYPVSETDPDVTRDGVTLENVTFDNIRYDGTAGHRESRYLNVVGSSYQGAVFDFRCMRPQDTFSHVVCQHISGREGAERVASVTCPPITFK